MSPEKQRRTFLSYSRVNKDFALALAKELKSEGFDVWLDQLDIPLGARWDREVERALRRSEIFMIILTAASVDSENVLDEIGYAIDTQMRFLPIVLEECEVPLRLRRFQYVDFTNKSFDEGVKAAKGLLRGLIDQPTVPRSAVVGDEKAEAGRKAKEGAERKAKAEAEHKAVEKAAREEAEREAAEIAAKEKAEREAAEKVVKLKAEREAAEKAAREKAEREAAEKAAREKAEREAAEKAAKEKSEREAAEKAARVKAEQKAAEKAAKEMADREAAEKTAKEKDEREATERAAIQMAEREVANKAVEEIAEDKAEKGAAQEKVILESSVPSKKSKINRPVYLGLFVAAIGLFVAAIFVVTGYLGFRLFSSTQSAKVTSTVMVRATNVTANAQVAEDPKATSTANARATIAANAEVTKAAKAEATKAAKAAVNTSVAALRITSTANALATLEAKMSFVATLGVDAQLVFGPEDGSLKHQDDDFIEIFEPSVTLSDFILTATFSNPYPTSTGSWDYGFLFRDSGKNEQYRLVVASDSSWELTNNEGTGNGTLIQDGYINSLDISADGTNTIRLIGQGDKGELYVNDNFVSELDLSARTNEGTVSIGTGFFSDDEIDGYATMYKDFAILSLQEE